jgi:hypothetical protein
MAAQVLLLVALTAALFGWLGYRWGVADTLLEQAVRQVRRIDLDSDRWAP